MKKSNFVTLVLGIISGLIFAIGMCMALITEWNTFKLGIVLGCLGVILGFITVAVWRKTTNKKPIHISLKCVLTIIVGAIGALALGVGMCFSMVWGKMLVGIVVGIVGIVILLSLIPLIKGFKE